MTIDLRTERLVGEPTSAADLEDYARLMNHPDVARTLGGIRTCEQVADSVAQNVAHFARHGFGAWSLRNRQTGGLVRRPVRLRRLLRRRLAVLHDRAVPRRDRTGFRLRRCRDWVGRVRRLRARHGRRRRLAAMLVALAQGAAVRRTRAVLPHILRISGAFLLLAGLYVAYYGWYELPVFAGDSADDAAVGAFTEIQGQVATWLDAIGVWWILAAFTLTTGIVVVLRAARRTRSGDGPGLGRHRKTVMPGPSV